MKRFLQTGVAAAILIAGMAAAILPAQSVVACTGKACVIDGANKVQTGATRALPDTIKQITDVLLFLLGAISVIMLVVGGFKFVTSNGNAEQVKNARHTITYAIVGVIVAVVAYSVISFVVDKL